MALKLPGSLMIYHGNQLPGFRTGELYTIILDETHQMVIEETTMARPRGTPTHGPLFEAGPPQHAQDALDWFDTLSVQQQLAWHRWLRSDLNKPTV